VRDQEIARLGQLYRGGQNFDQVKLNYDRAQAEDTIGKLTKQNDFINQENQRLSHEMQEIRELIGVCESKDPTDVDRMHLKKLVKELVRRNEILTSEVRELNKVVDQLKEGRYNEMEVGKHLSHDEISRLQRQLAEAERAKEEAVRESQRIKSESEKVLQYQSAYMSNQKAFNEKIEELVAEVRGKEEELR
jgi:plectin